MLFVLGALGLLTLPLSVLLVVNTISALLARQVRQIGVMKAIGGHTRQIMGIYLNTALIFGLLSLVVAVPLGAMAARELINFMAYFINFNKLSEFHIPPQVLALEVAMGLLLPLIAAYYPILIGTRVTVHEAITNYGIEGQASSAFIDRLIAVRGLPRPLLLSLRNTFRRKARLVLTLVVLVLGGAIFVAVSSVRDSIDLTIEDLFRYWQFDVQIELSRPYPIKRIENDVLDIPGVVKVEGWSVRGVYHMRADGSESRTIYMVALPNPTDMLQPTLRQGRWLHPEDENAVVVSTRVLADEPDIKVGDEIILKIEGRETPWRVVGAVQTVGETRFVYANRSYFMRVVREMGSVSTVQVITEQHDPAFRSQVAKALQEHFENTGLRANAVTSVTDIRAGGEAYFTIIVAFLSIMALLLTMVSGLALMGTMSINVLEQTGEIGIMRAIGASGGDIMQIFLVEGILIGLISWPLSVILALPLSKVLSDNVGIQFLQSPLSYVFSVEGALLWLALVALLAALATYLPARDASRLAVREVLTYE
jgi:putative ABC transport system permease protein